MHYPDSRWRPRCQGKSRDDVSGRIIIFYLPCDAVVCPSPTPTLEVQPQTYPY